MNSGVTVKGFVISRILDKVKDKLSDEEFQALQDRLQVEYKRLKFNVFKDYTAELQIAAEEEAAKILHGSASDDNIFRGFGRENFDAFAETIVGRTVLKLTNQNPQRMMETSMRLMGTVMGGMQIEINHLGDNRFSFRFRNNPYRPLGWQGVIEAALEHAGVRPTIQTVRHGGKDIEYIISW